MTVVVLHLIFLYFSSSDEDSPSGDIKGLLADVRDQLLQGLADDAESIRYVEYTITDISLGLYYGIIVHRST